MSDVPKILDECSFDSSSSKQDFNQLLMNSKKSILVKFDKEIFSYENQKIDLPKNKSLVYSYRKEIIDNRLSMINKLQISLAIMYSIIVGFLISSFFTYSSNTIVTIFYTFCLILMSFPIFVMIRCFTQSLQSSFISFERD